jgi:hypothetical protein
MLLTLRACNSTASTAALEYVLRHPSRRHQDINMFRRLKQSFDVTGCVTPMSQVNAVRPRTLRTPANAEVTTTAVERISGNNSDNNMDKELRNRIIWLIIATVCFKENLSHFFSH